MLLAAMGPPGGSRQDVCERFLRHFSIYAMNAFTDDSMTRIFTNVLVTGLKVCLLIAECQIIQNLMFVLVLLSFSSAAYTLYLYSYSQHGSIYSGLYSCSLGYVREFLLIFLHWFLLNLVILKVDIAVFWV